MARQGIDGLLDANVEFAKTWKTPPTMKQMRSVLGDPLIILTCMDPRVIPENFLGPNAFFAVTRNAGGRATPDAVRTIATLQSLALGAKNANVMVIHHTDCGMTHLTNDGIKHDVAERGGSEHEQIDFGCFAAKDIENSVRDDMQVLRSSKVLKDVTVRGFVLDTDTALLREL